MAECFTCRNTDDPAAPPRERVLRTGEWRVAHATDAGLPGWLVVVPLQHVTSLDELTPEAAAELGPLLRDVTAALIAVTGCRKTYVLLLAEKEGFGHVHFHVVPRAADLPEEFRGPRIFGLLGVPVHDRVPEQEQDRLAEELHRDLVARRS